ncbi:hypothetical protein [Dactylosporangium sp. NPDC051541]|uniref:hypothetical protein n=1 Tax=Dactylosporangium sp. NPDC051541 TaxID=3363977 RepID=UPI0037A290AB
MVEPSERRARWWRVALRLAGRGIVTSLAHLAMGAAVLVPWTPIAWPQYTAGLLEAERERPLTPAEERAWRTLVEQLRVPAIAEEEQ